MRSFVLTILLFFIGTTTKAQQQLVEVLSETFTVNSISAMTGNTRNTAEVVLPDKAIGYVYRLTVTQKGKGAISNSLYTLLKQRGGNIALGVSIAEFAIQNNDGNTIDAYIFSNTYDKDNFYLKKDGNWNACKSILNRSSSCFSTADCISKRIFFGFKNSNLREGLDVKLEVVAIVDQTSWRNVAGTFTISNQSDGEKQYFLSQDGIKWETKKLRAGYSLNHTIAAPAVHFRMYTTQQVFVNYKIIPQERYKIVWNVNKWDLMRY